VPIRQGKQRGSTGALCEYFGWNNTAGGYPWPEPGWPEQFGKNVTRTQEAIDSVRHNPGAIGYGELSLVRGSKTSVPIGLVRNQAGAFVEPSAERGFNAMHSLASVPDSLWLRPSTATDKTAYPIVMTIWLVLSPGLNPERQREMVKFLRWYERNGAKYLEDVHHALPPPVFLQRNEALLKALGS
jgi:ABC-type phosphate transport system substrate-binding protein